MEIDITRVGKNNIIFTTKHRDNCAYFNITIPYESG